MAVLGSKKVNYQVNANEINMISKPAATAPITISAQKKPITFDLSRTALVIVDMQNDFCSEGGIAHTLWGVDLTIMNTPVAPLNTLIPLLRKQSVPIIWVNWGNRKDKANLSPCLLQVFNSDGKTPGLGDAVPNTQSTAILEKNSWGAAIIDALDYSLEDDMFIDKYRMSGFWDTPLDSILRQLDIRTVLFSGVNVDQCVFTTLTDANFYGYDTILIEDCCATSSPDFCRQATLYNVRQCFGFTTLSDNLLTALKTKDI